jgi:Actinobacteria/chloroflexi VLRF1 release factor
VAVKNVAGSGAKWLDVSAERFPGWIASFARRHGEPGEPGPLGVALADGIAAFTAADGARAECHPPFPESFASPPESVGPVEAADLIAAHAQVPRAVGVFLVRLGGYAAGVFTGYPPVLADAKTGSRLVHGRSAAGGWSQQRFARRRAKQANEALDAAADTAVAVFGRGPRLDAVVLGGDKRAMAELRGEPRLARYLALATERFLTVPDPKRAVLEGTPRLFTAVRIRISEPSS